MIFRKSLDTGVVPRQWRQANVVSIFKKGDKAESSNYRRISLTSVDYALDCRFTTDIFLQDSEHLLLYYLWLKVRMLMFVKLYFFKCIISVSVNHC